MIREVAHIRQDQLALTVHGQVCITLLNLGETKNMLFGDIYLIPGPYHYYTTPAQYNLFRVYIVNRYLNLNLSLKLNY